ncbi:MAG: NYN domain-containing protein [Burkholderiales bacterium]|nr:NYN domain-containing protein [Burkholderiales bacterium]
MTTSHPPRETRIALLIDADNSPAKKIDLILAELAKLGVANIRRAYGNWKKNELKGWEEVLHECAIRPIQQFDVSKGKNATDMLIAIDALDLLYTDRPDAFGIVSSDADFTPLVMHLRAKGATVYGFGAKKTPAPFVAACSRFLFLESLGEDEAEPEVEGVPESSAKPSARKPRTAAKKKPEATDLKRDARLVSLLRNAVEAAAGDDGWSNLSAVRTQIDNQAPFDPRNHGFKKFSDLIDAIGLFDTERRGQNLYVRDKRQARGAGRGA